MLYEELIKDVSLKNSVIIAKTLNDIFSDESEYKRFIGDINKYVGNRSMQKFVWNRELDRHMRSLFAKDKELLDIYLKSICISSPKLHLIGIIKTTDEEVTGGNSDSFEGTGDNTSSFRTEGTGDSTVNRDNGNIGGTGVTSENLGNRDNGTSETSTSNKSTEHISPNKPTSLLRLKTDIDFTYEKREYTKIKRHIYSLNTVEVTVQAGQTFDIHKFDLIKALLDRKYFGILANAKLKVSNNSFPNGVETPYDIFNKCKIQLNKEQ